jgi:hypothetical protein
MTLAMKRAIKRAGRKSAPNTSRKRAAKKKARKAGRQIAATKKARRAARRPTGSARRSNEGSGGSAAPSRPGARRLTPAKKRTLVGKARGRKAKSEEVSERG